VSSETLGDLIDRLEALKQEYGPDVPVTIRGHPGGVTVVASKYGYGDPLPAPKFRIVLYGC